MSSLHSRYKQHGYISTIEIWPRRSDDRPMHCARVHDEEVSKHDATFEYLYGVLEKHPMMLSEWNSAFRNRGNVNTCGRDMLLFEHWVSRNHPGHMPYMSTWDELDGRTRSSWRNHSDKMIPSPNTVFVCLLGISYSH